MFFITGLQNIDYIDSFDDLLLGDNDTRTLGYFETEEEALTAVGDNSISQIVHPGEYVIIEQIRPGIHPRSEVVQWFKYNKANNVYEPIKEVESVIVNFAMIG